MGEGFSTKRLLTLRKLTRAVADLLRSQAKDYLATLAPLLRPGAVLGHFVEGQAKETVQGADRALKELQSQYEAIAGAKPFNLRKELKPPLELSSTLIEMTPLEYAHVIKTDQGSKTVIVSSPLKWVLSYSGYAPGRLTSINYTPKRLRELLADRNRAVDEVQQFLVHYLILNLILTKQSGVSRILEALHFPTGSIRSAEFGELPMPVISSALATIRPPDDVIVENTEISGTDAFEEVIRVEDIASMQDPLRERLVELVKGHGMEPVSES
jgi:hypothetical protein